MTTLTARRITAVIRDLFPDIEPLTTARNLSGNGLVLSWTVTMPEPAARNWDATSLAGSVRASAYLSRYLGTEVHVADVYATPRRSGGKLAHIVIKRGTL